MLGPVVVDVTTLAPSREIAIGVVGGVVIPVRGRQYHPRRADLREDIVAADRGARDPTHGHRAR